MRTPILIGMPGAGKTTVGRILAERLGYRFIDTDRVLERRAGCTLSALLASRGLAGFRQLEERILLTLRPAHAVIATGGSVVYGARGMRALRQLGVVVFLHCPLGLLRGRLGDHATRGMVIAPGQSLAALYRERLPLYRRYAQVVVGCGKVAPVRVAERVLRRLKGRAAGVR